MEADLRKLERVWQTSGSNQDLVHLLRARLRAGLDPARLNIAAGLLHPAAQEALGLPITSKPPGILRLGKDKEITARDIPQCLGQMWDYDAERVGYGPGNFQIDVRLEALRIMANVLMQIQEWMLRRARMMFGVSPDARGVRDRIENLQNMIDQAIQNAQNHRHTDNWHNILSEMSELIADFRGGLIQIKPPPYDYDDANTELREKLLKPVFDWSLGHTEALGDTPLPDFSRRRRNPSQAHSMRVRAVTAWREDIGKNLIRIPKRVRRAIGVDLGDKVLAEGPTGSTLLTAIIADRTEIGKKVAGIDAATRRALGVELGAKFTISKPQSSTSRRSDSVWLFNYGSNNPEQLEERLGYLPDEISAAYLPNYRLKFLGYSLNWEGGVAGLVKERGSEACGYVAKVTSDDLAVMDGFEGVSGGYYYRKKLPVMVDVDGEFVGSQAIVYLPGPLRLNAPEHHAPSSEYLDAVEMTIFSFWDTDGECRYYLDEALGELD